MPAKIDTAHLFRELNETFPEILFAFLFGSSKDGITENKPRTIEEKIQIINNRKIKSLQDLKDNTMLHFAVERALQVAVEALIDVAERIVALNKIPPQINSASNMSKLQELHILSNAAVYTDMIRFRNS